MAKAQRVLSIEVGYSLTKVCEMDYRSKHPKVYGVFSMKTPQGVLDDGYVRPSGEFSSELRSYLEANGMHAKKVIFSVSSTKIANREAMIPAVKENKVRDMVLSNVTDYFPVDPSMYQFAHNIMNTVTDNAGNKQYHLMLMAVPGDIFEGYVELAKALGLELDSIEYSGNSIFQVLKSKFATGTNLVVKIDERNSLITVIRNGVISMQRSGIYGADQIVETLMETDAYGEKLTYEAAVKTLRRNNLVMRADEEEILLQREKETEELFREQEEAAERASSAGDTVGAAAAKVASKQADANLKMLRLRKDITYSYNQLISSIVRVIDYYNSKNREAAIDRIVITGIAADFWGFSNLLAAELGRDVEVLRDLAGTNINQGLHLQDISLGDYISVIGAGLSVSGFSLNAVTVSKDKKGTKGATGKKSKVGVIILGIGAVIAVGLAAWAAVPYFDAKTENDALLLRKQQLQEIQPIYDTYVQVEADYQYLTSVYAQTENYNSELHQVLADLETLMPTKISIDSLNITSTDVSISATYPNKRSVAKAIIQLRSIDYFSDVSCTSVATKQETLENSNQVNTEVTATIMCTYGVNPKLLESETDVEEALDAMETVE
ncbi:MAG: hypothetical protein NC412_02245 [Roseburia sp.]|nr:hypothetical protein [Roseburia sp.]MCM1278062.1 hypothetical protein [Robinsoniella sp.]